MENLYLKYEGHKEKRGESSFYSANLQSILTTDFSHVASSYILYSAFIGHQITNIKDKILVHEMELAKKRIRSKLNEILLQ